MAEIERELVKKSFGSHAGQYESLALVQRKITDRFVQLLSDSSPHPDLLLDIGAGTGRLLHLLAEALPATGLVGLDLAFGMTALAKDRCSSSGRTAFICGDAENLPFQDSCFDLVVSTSTYQWLNPLEAAFTEAYRVLKPESRFCFALFGEKTLFELRESYQSAAAALGMKAADRTHNFATSQDVLCALAGAGFTGCSVTAEIETEIHPDVPHLLRALKGIGAGSAARSHGSGLSGRSIMQRMMELYREKYGTNGGIRATYQVLYGVGKKGCC